MRFPLAAIPVTYQLIAFLDPHDRPCVSVRGAISTPALLRSLTAAIVPPLSTAADGPSRPRGCGTAEFAGFGPGQERAPMAPDPLAGLSAVRHRASLRPPARKPQRNRGAVDG
jgi:hypothetical protein